MPAARHLTLAPSPRVSPHPRCTRAPTRRQQLEEAALLTHLSLALHQKQPLQQGQTHGPPAASPPITPAPQAPSQPAGAAVSPPPTRLATAGADADAAGGAMAAAAGEPGQPERGVTATAEPRAAPPSPPRSAEPLPADGTRLDAGAAAAAVAVTSLKARAVRVPPRRSSRPNCPPQRQSHDREQALHAEGGAVQQHTALHAHISSGDVSTDYSLADTESDESTRSDSDAKRKPGSTDHPDTGGDPPNKRSLFRKWSVPIGLRARAFFVRR